MGSAYHVTVVFPDEAGAADENAIYAQVERLLERLNQQMSTYRDDSEISRFNAAQSTDWFPVSSDLAEVVQFSLDLSKRTDGVFDITVAPLVNLWGFGPRKASSEVPSQAAIVAARALTGYQKLSVRIDPPALRKSAEQLTLDVNALAPGFACDQVVELLQEIGARDGLVEIGGEVRAFGQRPGGGPWRVGIERPEGTDDRTIEQVVELNNESLATSGDYRKFFIDSESGVRYSHTIDPRTGSPISHDLASITIVCSSCMAADAWATAITVLGPEEGKRLAEREGLDCLVIRRSQEAYLIDGTGRFAK